MALAGITASEIIHLARAYQRLRKDTRKARTIDAIEAAAARYGQALGGTALRTLVAIAVALTGTAAPRPPALPPGAPAVSLVNGGTVTLNAPRSQAAIKLLADDTVAIVQGGMAMAALNSPDQPPPAQSESDPLAVVPRRGMGQRVVNDKNGNPVTLYGQSRSPSRTPGHDATI